MAPVISLASRRSLSARAELTRRGFPVAALESALPETQTDRLLRVERDIFAADKALFEIRSWLKHARGAGRVRAQVAADEAMVELQRLERVRTRIVGAELAVLEGGRL